MTTAPKYRRVLIKISGEAFCKPGGQGIDTSAVEALADELAPLPKLGVQVGLVMGAGNILRGKDFTGKGLVPRATADAMGMLATVMNALALQEVLERRGTPARVCSAIPAPPVCEPYIRRRVLKHLEKGRIVLLAGGTGSPFFTTDTAAALRACEIGAEVLFKATKVDGVFDSDPMKNKHAKKFDRLTYADVLSRQLGVMDLAAVSLCMEARIPVVVFRMDIPGHLAKAIRGQKLGTVIAAE